MINSLILQSYSPIIIPSVFVYAINYIERGLLLGNVELLGLFILLGSILIYYDRVNALHKEYVLSGLILFFVSYVIFLQTDKVFLNFGLISTALIMIAYGLVGFEFYSEKNQYIYLSLLVLLVSFTIMIPYERKQIGPYSMSIISIALGITILVFTTINTPVLK